MLAVMKGTFLSHSFLTLVSSFSEKSGDDDTTEADEDYENPFNLLNQTEDIGMQRKSHFS